MDLPGEFVSGPFDVKHGGVLAVEARLQPPATLGGIEFAIEGSEDGRSWTEWSAGSVSGGQRVEVPCRDGSAPWGRVRLRSIGGEARVSWRRFGEGDR